MKTRIASVDVFRALTMLLMIFVNDLWTLHDIPGWLEHTTAEEDGMGLADVVFPAFLFIVGLSIPFAIEGRFRKGDSKTLVFFHIVRRTLALVIMGFFMVNSEYFRDGVPQAFKTTWEILMLIAFLLIWNNYEQKRVWGKMPVIILQIAGILILVMLAVTFKGGSTENPAWMSPHWWGILGIIGWSYLLCSVLYLLVRNRIWIMIFLLLVLQAMNVQEFSPVFGMGHGFRFLVSASHHALVMSGVVATLIYLQLKDNSRRFLIPLTLACAAAISILYGFSVRPNWGISKILATPSWTAICAGISFAFFAFLYIICDVLQSTRWANILMPAGRSTLTCYLLPGLVYPFLWPLEQLLPAPFLGGLAGLIKSIIFALLIIILTGLLEKIRIRMKI